MLHVVTVDNIGPARRLLGKTLICVSLGILGLVALCQAMQTWGGMKFGFSDWRPTLYAYLLFSTCLCWAQVILTGEHGKRVLFILPSAMFVLSLSIFPLIFGLVIAFSDWNLSSPDGRHFNGLANLRQMWADAYFWNAMENMVWYCLAVVPEYVIAFGLALILNAQVRAQKFFRVSFLLPLMLSPVAVSWMIGKSMFVTQPAGPIVRLLESIGISSPMFYSDPWIARVMIMLLDAWTYIPFMMIMILAGLQAIPKELQEAARVDGARGWRAFWEVTFPLMLPVSITALLIRLIFKLKLADIVITLTSGGPGGATDSVTSFIYREYRDRSNVGYGTLLAMVYLVVIVILMTLAMKFADKAMHPRT
ncbi:MAG: sugar ABC transporter permease [Mesorhizobium sp.]|nr:MAG: sugar ABC transporter permease [Mesorhizobium sp.]